MMLNFKPFTLSLRDRTLVLDRPQIMGIVNVTPDSFYSASRTFDVDSLEKKVEQMVSEGVDIFDIGAYSTRPGADDVSPEEELRRFHIVIENVADNGLLCYSHFCNIPFNKCNLVLYYYYTQIRL